MQLKNKSRHALSLHDQWQPFVEVLVMSYRHGFCWVVHMTHMRSSFIRLHIVIHAACSLAKADLVCHSHYPAEAMSTAHTNNAADVCSRFVFCHQGVGGCSLLAA